jgi:AcrR family transcriptional regulator
MNLTLSRLSLKIRLMASVNPRPIAIARKAPGRTPGVLRRAASGGQTGAEKKPGKGVSTRRDPAAYHHGDLRAALLAAAEQVLLERGVEGFTLRECARRAGVSHAAPTHHFGDVRGLLTAFAQLGFERMAAMMQAARQASARDARGALMGVGMAYIEFAVTHRAQFALMFRGEAVDVAALQSDTSGTSAFDHLQQTLAAASLPDLIDAQTLEQRAMLAWSAVHGFANLVLDGGISDPANARRSPHQIALRLGPPLLKQLLPALIDTPNAAMK